MTAISPGPSCDFPVMECFPSRDKPPLCDLSPLKAKEEVVADRFIYRPSNDLEAPSELSSLKSVRQLVIENVSCDRLPESIGQLALSILHIENCPNLHLPESVKRMPTLRGFYVVADSYPQQLFEEIGELHLESVGIRCRSEIEHLPHSLQKISTLQFLYVDPCSTHLVTEISQLPLKSLCIIGDNNFDHIPPSLESMKSLRYLQVVAPKLRPKPNDPVLQALSDRDVNLRVTTFLH